MPILTEGSQIVFFDGICVICNGFIGFLFRRSKHLYFSSLQSDYAQEHLADYDVPDSIIFREKTGELYLRSDAFLRIICSLGGFWKLAVVFFICPKFLRDTLYDFLARKRYSWFGKRKICRVPSSEEKLRFLE